MNADLHVQYVTYTIIICTCNIWKIVWRVITTIKQQQKTVHEEMIFQKNDALLKEIEQLKEQYVIKFQEVSGKIDKCR